ncbi:MAG: hypothetical protein GX801_01410, partial [Fibrobacter sp.]|nr:hypothetical protein [Fibrobacter sp.]
HPSIIINSTPEAQIFPAESSLDGKIKSLGKTPFMLKNFDLEEINWRIWAVGYKDSILNFVPNPMGKNIFEIKLEPEKDPVVINMQTLIAKKLKKQQIAKVLKYSSIAPLLLGPTFVWLAHNDFTEAKDIKKDLEQPSSGSGPHFDKLKQKNADAIHLGKNTVLIGSSLHFTGVLMLTIGISLDC